MHLALLWHANVGGEINADSHGDVNVGVQAGPWSLELQTDTLDARWSPSGEKGRSWMGLRGAGFAAEMVISPWIDGAPAPERSFRAMYGGVDAGTLRYFGYGFYGGGQFSARYYHFYGREDVTLPEDRPVLSPEVLAGWWSPVAELKLSAGADWSGGRFAPRFQTYGRVSPGWVVAPLVEARVGLGSGQDWLTASRIGGLNPYVVPLAGAAWAEFRAEDYAAGRVGARFQWQHKPWGLQTGPLADLVWFQGEEPQPILPETGMQTADSPDSAARTAVGLGWHNHLSFRCSFLDLDGGWAPWLPRAPGVGAWSIWFRLGTEWGRAS